MRIEISTNFDINKLDILEINQIGLYDSAEEIKGQAQDNAPYQTGKLRQGIGIEPGIIAKGTNKVKIGPRKIVYAVRREFENFKNPSKKFYMYRTYKTADTICKNSFEKAVRIAIKRLKSK